MIPIGSKQILISTLQNQDDYVDTMMFINRGNKNNLNSLFVPEIPYMAFHLHILNQNVVLVIKSTTSILYLFLFIVHSNYNNIHYISTRGWGRGARERVI